MMFIQSWIMQLFQINNNFPEADFWLINKGAIPKGSASQRAQIGKPVKEYRSCLTGIKCNEELILPSFGFYACLHLYQTGIWRGYGRSCINLVSLRIKDIRNVLNNSFVI